MSGLRAQQRLDSAALVQGAVALPGLLQRQLDLAGINLSAPDQVDQLWQEAAHQGRAAEQVDFRIEQVLAAQFHAMGDPDVADVPARAGEADRLQHGFLGTDGLDNGVCAESTAQQAFAGNWQTKMEEVTGISVGGIDRYLIAVDPNRRWGQTMLDDIEANGIANLTQNVILDPVHHDYFTRKLLAALEAIGNPPIASSRPLVQQATGQMTGRGSQRSAHTPPADVLWDARTMHSTPVTRALQSVRTQMVAAGIDLNPAQWQAWQDALSCRLQLIWGPPGTGKSRTAQAIVVGAAVEASQQGKPLRILVSASTYNAIDIVLLTAYQDLMRLLPQTSFEAYRVRSYLQPVNSQVPTQMDVELNRSNPSAQVLALRQRLQRGSGIIIVGAPPEQVHNLLVASNGAAQQELFDLILVDEASQMDIAHGILALCAIARGGSVIVAGDPQQLPPIHQAEPPLGLETMVGSIYAFFHAFQKVPHVMLSENYRSSSSLVDFAYHAGYYSTLASFSPDLRLNYLSQLPTTQPPNWPCAGYSPDPGKIEGVFRVSEGMDLCLVSVTQRILCIAATDCRRIPITKDLLCVHFPG